MVKKILKLALATSQVTCGDDCGDDCGDGSGWCQTQITCHEQGWILIFYFSHFCFRFGLFGTPRFWIRLINKTVNSSRTHRLTAHATEAAGYNHPLRRQNKTIV